ncbi:MAG: hypothetical protein ACREE6_07270, partial [Limisphaerales bacterium]
MKIRNPKGIAALAILTPAMFALLGSIAHSQNVVFTYQGRITDNGTNFSGAGQFEFALVTSTNANSTATATADAPSGGKITGYIVTYGGNGYTGAPTVTITGGSGSGATAVATVSDGVVTAITVNNQGSGYSSAPTVTVAPPPPDNSYTTYWSNDGTSVNGSEPAVAVPVTVNDGLFTVTLGDTNTANMAAIESSLFAQPNLRLRIWFNDGANGFAALDPAQNLTPTPYATVAQNANGGLFVEQNSSGAPNVIGGSPANVVSGGITGATIGGGGSPGMSNSITANFGTVGGGIANTAGNNNATVGGGNANVANGLNSTVAGGQYNRATNGETTVGGGQYNTASSVYATVGGGDGDIASGQYATVGGGEINVASGNQGTVGGGGANHATNSYDTVGGGNNNLAGGGWATVPGGRGNVANGLYSFAAGQHAQALHQGAFVWADSQNAAFSSTANDQFLVRAQGGVGINTSYTLGGSLTVNTNAYLFSHPLYLRGDQGIDHNHGLAYNGNTVTNFGTGQYQVDGPALWGYGGGVLGTREGG